VSIYFWKNYKKFAAAQVEIFTEQL